MSQAVLAHPFTAVEESPLPAPLRSRRRLILTALAGVVFVAAVLALGLEGLLPFGPLLALSIRSDDEGARRSVTLTARNIGLAAAMLAALAYFWLWYIDLTPSTLAGIAGVLIALPLALQESAGESSRGSTIAVTRRSLILALWGMVTFAYLYQDRGQWQAALVVVSVILPLVLAVLRARGARKGKIEFGLLRHPLRKELRPHLMQALNIWILCALLAGVLVAGAAYTLRTLYGLNLMQFNIAAGAFAAGLVLLAALAMIPRRRVHVATNVVVAILSGFLALQLARVSVSPTDAVVLQSPLRGEWFVSNAGRSTLINGHPVSESNAVDFRRLGANGLTHTGGSDAPLTDYAGFGMPVVAPADGRIVFVADGYADTPPGINGDSANHLVLDMGGSRYVVLAHFKKDSVTVNVGDRVQQGDLLAAVGNSGHTNEPHLHLHIQDSLSGDSGRTYPVVFRNVDITKGGAWPWGDSRELRTGDLVRALGQ